MIHITQGHEKSISLEVFFKSLIMLSPKRTQKHLKLHCSSGSLKQNLELLNFEYKIINDKLVFHHHEIDLAFIDDQGSEPQSTRALLSAFSQLHENDILITLPTSKDQLIFQGKQLLGHTEFLRSFYKKPYLPMFFYSHDLKVLLLTDHIPLSDIDKNLSADLIHEKIETSLQGMSRYFKPLQDIIIAGLNPHAGEGKLLGDGDYKLTKAREVLEKNYTQIKFSGPVSGDTLHHFYNEKREQLLVYCYHDQGLPLFKSRQQFWGLNITFGLPYLRMSVDHGTAFDLWGKNKANFLGCYDVLITALNITDKL